MTEQVPRTYADGLCEAAALCQRRADEYRWSNDWSNRRTAMELAKALREMAAKAEPQHA